MGLDLVMRVLDNAYTFFSNINGYTIGVCYTLYGINTLSAPKSNPLRDYERKSLLDERTEQLARFGDYMLEIAADMCTRSGKKIPHHDMEFIRSMLSQQRSAQDQASLIRLMLSQRGIQE